MTVKFGKIRKRKPILRLPNALHSKIKRNLLKQYEKMKNKLINFLKMLIKEEKSLKNVNLFLGRFKISDFLS
jgi:hypothetical protein